MKLYSIKYCDISQRSFAATANIEIFDNTKMLKYLIIQKILKAAFAATDPRRKVTARK